MTTAPQHGEIYQVGVSCTGVYEEPSEFAPIGTMALFGETVSLLGTGGTWANIVADLDKYPGSIRQEHLVRPFAATHSVNVPIAAVYHEANFKKPLLSFPLYFNSRVRVEEAVDTPEGKMCRVKGAGWVFADHLCDLGYRAPDFVAEMLRLVEFPYLWGARGWAYDCSSALQAACIAAGIDQTRDCGPQSRTLGEAIDFAQDFSNLRRGDLAFWTEGKGRHVVVMVDRERCVHGTVAYPHRKFLVQPLREVIADQARDGNGPVTIVRRFPDYRPA
jgi:hypothetical protein